MKKTLLLALCLLSVFLSLQATKQTINITTTGGGASALTPVLVNIDTLVVTSTADLNLADLNAIRDKFKGKAASSFTIDLSGAKFANNTMPGSSTNGSGAFDLGSSYFSCLKEVILPPNLKAISARAFRYCNSLAKINLPEGLEVIGDLAFAQNASKMNLALSFAELPNSVKTIGQYAFQANRNLSLTKLPDALAGEISTRVFSHTPIAISKIPEGVTTIKSGAFNPEAEDRAKITSIAFPTTLTVLESGAFTKQTKILVITFKTQTPPFATDADPFSSIPDKSKVTLFIPKNAIANYEGYSAFDGMTVLGINDEDNPPVQGELRIEHNTTGQMSAEIAAALDGLTVSEITKLSIRGTAFLNFDDCQSIANAFSTASLQELDLISAKFLNDSIPSYSQSGNGAFSNMKMKSIALPNSLRVIGDRAFISCTVLNTVEFSPLLKKIGFAAFSGCASLNFTSLPENVESIAGYAFQNCSDLALSALPSALKGTIGAYAFSKTKVTIKQIPYGVTSIDNSAFSNVGTIKELIFPSTLISIGNKAFEKNELTSITIKSPNPPSVSTNEATHSFFNVVLGNIILHVPNGTIANFDFAPWNEMTIVDDADEEIITENPRVINTSYEGKQRKYLLYRPQNNFNRNPDGVLVTCHGFGGKMENALPIYGFQAAADALNLIVISPQALAEEDQDLQSQASNIGYDLSATWGQVLYAEVKILGGILGNIKANFNKDINDIEFIHELIDKTATQYSANRNNVFIGGISMGGFMAYGYALRYGNELAGIINIAGSMGLKVNTENVTASLPILDFHSTTDQVVFYEGAGKYGGSALIDMKNAIPKLDVLQYWAGKNNITTNPTETYLGENKGVSIKKIHFEDADKNEILHYQLTGAEHSHNLSIGNGDAISHSAEIRSFIQRHMTEEDAKTDVSHEDETNSNFKMSANGIYIDGFDTLKKGFIYTSLGKLVKTVVLHPDMTNFISLEDLPSGIYLCLPEGEATIKFMKK